MNEAMKLYKNERTLQTVRLVGSPLGEHGEGEGFTEQCFPDHTLPSPEQPLSPRPLPQMEAEEDGRVPGVAQEWHTERD